MLVVGKGAVGVGVWVCCGVWAVEGWQGERRTGEGGLAAAMAQKGQVGGWEVVIRRLPGMVRGDWW